MRQKYDFSFMIVEGTTVLIDFALDAMGVDANEATYDDLLYAFGIVATVLYRGGDYDQSHS